MKHIRKLACLLLIFVMAMAFSIPAAASQKEEVQGQLDEYQEKQSQLQSELEELKKNKDDAESYLNDLEAKIDQILDKMDKTTEDLKKTNEEIIVTKEDLAAAQRDADEQYDALKARIKAIYESGDINYLDILLGGGDLKMMLNSMEYASKVNQYDRMLLQKLQRTRDRISDYKANLEEKRDLQEEQMDKYKSDKEDMELVLAQRQEEIDALGDDINSINYDINALQEKLDAQESALAEIENQEAEAAAAAEERRRAEAAAADSQNSSSVEEEVSEPEEEPETEPETETETEEDEEPAPIDYSWSGQVLNPWVGTVEGPSGTETYYNLDMSGVVGIMRDMGFDAGSYPYWVRSDGCKMLGDYIMVAADLSIRPRGSTIPTSLGMGLVCDTGSFIYSNPTQLDIATNW